MLDDYLYYNYYKMVKVKVSITINKQKLTHRTTIPDWMFGKFDVLEYISKFGKKETKNTIFVIHNAKKYLILKNAPIPLKEWNQVIPPIHEINDLIKYFGGFPKVEVMIGKFLGERKAVVISEWKITSI